MNGHTRGAGLQTYVVGGPPGPRLLLVMLLLAVGCSAQPEPETTSTNNGTEVEPDAGNNNPDTGEVLLCPADIAVSSNGREPIAGRGDCVFTVTFPPDTLAELTLVGATFEPGEVPLDEPGWIRPQVLGGDHTVQISGTDDWSLSVDTFGTPVAEIDRERSLVWIDPDLLDDPANAGLGRLMRAAAAGDNPGELFADWFRRFATTAHSERVGPVQFLEQLEAAHGTNPAVWDLDTFPFVVTAVHNRTDLADATSCGQLRVSLASTDPVFQPFHAIFLFDQVPGDGDVSPSGLVHCGATLRTWASLSDLDDAAFRAAAREILDTTLTAETFLIAETVEFIISPWEWRQWLPTDTEPGSELQRVFQNPPMFQTVDAPRLNAPGSTRDAFLDYVAENAAALDARDLLLPEQFRAKSARVSAGIPWIPLDLSGLDPAVVAEFPELRQNIEIVGCPACHAADADFVQTRPDRTFSPFYDKELDARAEHLDGAHRGLAATVPFGPLQTEPVLTP